MVVFQHDNGREHEAVRERDTGHALAGIGQEAGHDGCPGILVPTNVGSLPISMSNGYPSSPSDAVYQIDALKEKGAIVDSWSPDKQERAAEFIRRDAAWLVDEVERLRQQVAQLQAEKAELQESLQQEKGFKDRYFSELCICHEQLQKLRSTPRT